MWIKFTDGQRVNFHNVSLYSPVNNETTKLWLNDGNNDAFQLIVPISANELDGILAVCSPHSSKTVAARRSEYFDWERSWSNIKAPTEVFSTISMLSPFEKRFLYWVTAEYYQGRGCIVDAGCFSGGSTVALAAGLEKSWPGPGHVIDSYDMFHLEEWMLKSYFSSSPVKPANGSFRPVFDNEIRRFAEKVIVHEGDITNESWIKGPIEILFIDVCKAWHINDHVVKEFFGQLIPGQSLVIQQDFFHHYEIWLAATMEIFNDNFEFVGHAPVNTAVFRLIKPIDISKYPERLRDLGVDRLAELISRHINRYTDSVQRGMLTLALAGLYIDFGDREKAKIIADRALTESGDYWVRISYEQYFPI